MANKKLIHNIIQPTIKKQDE